MELLVLNENFVAIDIIDTFESCIWTDRYNEYGDFELYISANSSHIPNLKKNNYLWSQDSEHVMIIDTHETDSDIEYGNKLIISGASLEWILDRRIIWKQTTISGSLQDGIKKLLTENVISPEITERKIDNFIFEESTDTRITELKAEAQFTGDSLYEAIAALCAVAGIGFKIILNDKNQFVFKLYTGEDRSYSQNANPYVTFSPKFGNIINSNYYSTDMNLKTVTLVGGEGEGSDRKTVVVEAKNGGGSGLSRREVFTDARDISSTTEGGTISTSEYNSQLSQRGSENLEDYVSINTFDGEVESNYLYAYGRDFFMGDIVQLSDEYGNEKRTRITEYIRSYSNSGIEEYPTFTSIDDNIDSEEKS